MVNINRNTNNTVVLTLDEKATLTGSTNYIMSLISNENKSMVKEFVLSGDSSLNTNRYNEYTIIENDTEVLSAMTVNLVDSSYDYRVYESTGNTIDSNSVLVESGLLLVDFDNDTFISGDTYQYTGTTINDDITFI